MANSEILKKIKDMGTVAKNSKVLKNIKDMGTSVSDSDILNKVKNTLSSKKVALPYGNPLAPVIYKAPSTASKVLSGAKKFSIPGLILSEGFMNTDDSSEIKAGREVPDFDFKRSAADNKLSDAINKKFATPAAPTSTQPSTPKDDKQKKPQNTTKGSGSGSGGKKISADYGTDLLTPDQVRDLQRASGELKVDGFVGPKTRAYAEKNGIPLTKEQFNAQPKVGEQVVVSSAEIPYTGKYSSMENAAIFNNLPSNVTLQEAKKQAVTPVEPGLASTQFNANDFKRFDDIRALQADQGMSELEATARYGQGMRPNATGLADAVTLNKAPVPVVPVSKGANPNQVLSDNLVKATKRQQNGY
jgi:hypothetical protein